MSGLRYPSLYQINTRVWLTELSQKFIKQVGESITPGTSALFLLTSHTVLDKVLEQTKDLKYEILQSNLSQQDEEKLRAAISASVGSTSADTATLGHHPRR